MDHKYQVPALFERVEQCDCLRVDFAKVHKGDHIVFDLNGLRFIKPPALVGLMMEMEHIYRSIPSPRLQILPPSNQAVLEYLYRIGLPDALRALRHGWAIPTPPGHTFSMNPLIPIQKFKSFQDVEKIANKMQELFMSGAIGPSTLHQPCHIIFSELADNILYHANSGGGYVVAQKYHHQQGTIIEIAIGDIGIGIKRSLELSYNLTNGRLSDAEVLQLAMQNGTTSTGVPTRGYGLGHVEAEVRGGAERIMYMRSGRGCATISTQGESQYVQCSKFPGTLTHIVMPCG
ncbi:permease-like protein [Dehalogenimonas sp. WBC-2]|nr:permease-like protein [Dehalogenimonas sp. WBC-2]